MACQAWSDDEHRISTQEFKDFSNLTRFACETIQDKLRANPDELESRIVPGYLLPWWERHKQADAERKRREEEETKQKALLESALAKLSPEERKALGK